MTEWVVGDNMGDFYNELVDILFPIPEVGNKAVDFEHCQQEHLQ
jgi:hypothetical protein